MPHFEVTYENKHALKQHLLKDGLSIKYLLENYAPVDGLEHLESLRS